MAKRRKMQTFAELSAPMRNLIVYSRTGERRGEPFRGVVRDVSPCQHPGYGECAGVTVHIVWPDGMSSAICFDLLLRNGESAYQIPK